MRSLQGKTQMAQATPPAVPTPSVEQLAAANHEGDPAQRGTAVYFAQGCFRCHGAVGNASGQLAFRNLGSDAEIACQIRFGPNGMPAYDQSKISDAQLQHVVAYLRSLPTPTPRARGPPGGGTPAPDHYSGTANGQPPACLPRREGPPGGAPSGAGTPRPNAERSATPTP